MPATQTAPNRVIAILAALALALLWLLNFASVQPNRIVPGTGIGLWQGLGGVWSLSLGLGLLLLAALGTLSSGRGALGLTAIIAALVLAAMPLALAHFTHQQITQSSSTPYARVGIGAGFWCLLFFLVLIQVEALRRLRAGPWLRLLTAALVAGAWLGCLATGNLDALSLVREFQNHDHLFVQALEIHLALALGSVGVSLVIGLATAIAMSRHQRLQRPVFAVVNFIQTIPSLALFGLLIVPLSALSAHSPLLRQLGVRGIGWAPAALALVAYSLLPMIRNSFVALTEIAPELLEAGRGMGMSERQLLSQVRLPLALPVIVEGVRVTSIQAIGLTAVAALIGAGGFGSFIFQGLGQAAMDLVLLGALPTIGLAVLADMLLGWLEKRLSPAHRRQPHD